MLADVSEGERAEQGITYRMTDDVRIGVTVETPGFVVEAHAPKVELAPLDKWVHVPTNTGPVHHESPLIKSSFLPF